MSESGLFCGEFVPISHPLLATIHPHCPPNIQLNTRKCASSAEHLPKCESPAWFGSSCLPWPGRRRRRWRRRRWTRGRRKGLLGLTPLAEQNTHQQLIRSRITSSIANIFWWSPKIFSENWSVALSASGADLLVIDSRAMLGAWRLFPSSLSSFVALKSWKETTRLNWTVMMWTDSILTFLP